MRLVRGAWKLLVGVKDALVLLFMLLFFGAIYFGLSARPNAAAVHDGALLVDLKGTIVEQPTSASPSLLLSPAENRTHEFRLRDVIAALDAAATDDRVKTVVLDLDGFAGGGQVALGDVGDALDRVRAKKPVLAFATAYGDDAYQLAAHASEIWVDPMGGALFAGPGGSRLYYKGLLDRLGVNAHIYRVGTFKSAVEPFLRADQSPEAKAANETLATALFQGWQADVSRARPKAQLAAYVRDPVAATNDGDLARSALRAGIVDKIGDKTAFNARVQGLAGRGSDKKLDYATIPLKSWIAANPRDPGSGRIGVVTVAGNIVDGEAPSGTAGGDTIVKIIRQGLATDKLKALVLRVDSGGGSALASERIRSALMEARRAGLPVVVSMGNVAASGGYWVAMTGDRVFAEPTTITGSIGVFGVIPTFENSLAKIGVTSDGVATTPLSGQPDIVGGTNAAFDTIVQKSVESTYRRFIALVSSTRKLEPARVDTIAQGRVWDGGSARQLGLIDAFGGVDDAIAEAARLAKLDPGEAHAVWLDKEPTWREALAAAWAESEEETPAAVDLVSTMTRARTAALAVAVADARGLATGSAIQARCLECPAPAALAVQPSLMQLAFAWLMR